MGPETKLGVKMSEWNRPLDNICIQFELVDCKEGSGENFKSQLTTMQGANTISKMKYKGSGKHL